MAFNKSKALENALKNLNQGKVAQAVAEYQQILRHDPKDQATLMTVGDLFARQGDMPQAIEYFSRLAQVYLSDGFNSKAIAIYKKIAKLAPAEIAPLEKLADLYVQQGVLSEARPLFLQIAEVHLKANRAQKAVEVLHRLLDIEPDNPRVQMRLAELYSVMGQKKEASETYLAYGQRLLERGEAEEAQKLIERAIHEDPANPGALLIHAKTLGAAGQEAKAIAILEQHPEADAGSDVTILLVDLYLRGGQIEKAADRARNQLVRGSAHFALLHRVADSLIESGQVREALPLLDELREPMIEASEQEKFVKSLTMAAERLPGDAAPLETLADFCRHTSDPFRLNAALGQLADVYADAGNHERAEEVLRELIDRNKNDERLVERLADLRTRRNDPARAKEQKPAFHSEPTFHEPPPPDAAPAPEPVAEEQPDEETARFISQALTDVDLFSSYGLTQKATHLLETVLQRAPGHTPTIERLLDFYLGAGDERRTAELASRLEQIYVKRGDTVNAERFADLRQRFQKAAGISEGEMPAAPPPTAAPAPSAPMASAAPPAAPAAPAEFEVPPAPLPEEPGHAAQEQPTAEQPPIAASPVAQAPAVHEEVDLSDEWAAMVQDVEPAQAPAEEIPPHTEPVPATQEAAPAEPAPEPTPEPAEAHSQETAAEPAAGGSELEIELHPEPAHKGAQPATGGKSTAVTTEDFIKELITEFEDMGMEAPPAAPTVAQAPIYAAPAPVAAAPETHRAAATKEDTVTESVSELAEVFQEFRDELVELGEVDEDEDLETHYNLGIAYREMGLLDEAIGEFQRVAKGVQNGKTFAYAMNCAALLALSFKDKGEARIASLWYQRALDVPGLDQEAILALRYDLGVSLEEAGDSSAALDNFRQVYAMNIDYRDVADRIAVLQKH